MFVSQATSFDPFSVWKSFYEKAETSWNQYLDETMRKEEFSEWMGMCLNTYLQQQDMIQKVTDNYLKQANLPSRTEVSNLAELIINLEEKVDSLEEKLDQILKMLQQNA